VSALMELAEWLVSLDDVANIRERATVSLGDIIRKARAALEEEK
jgi:hypothetical protein